MGHRIKSQLLSIYYWGVELFFKCKGAVKNSLFTQYLCFVVGRYSILSFNPALMQKNMERVLALQDAQWLDCSMKGELFSFDGKGKKWRFSLKNSLLLGAFRKRVLKVLAYTLFTFTLELTNPVDRKSLKKVVALRLRLADSFLKRVKKVNGKEWPQSEALVSIDLYKRGSLIQEHEILWMERVLGRQRETELVKRAKEALKKGFIPHLEIHGASGTYWMCGEKGELLGLFKPFDEEMCGPNNPIGFSHQGALGKRKARISQRVGEGAHREVSAYLIDTLFDLALVPETVYAAFSHSHFFAAALGVGSSGIKKKMGSFQEYVPGLTPLIQIPKSEIDKIDEREFQYLLLLDVIIGNSDRHANNIMIKEGHIVAIDHGLAFPDINMELSSWYWGLFPQLAKPLPIEMVDFLLHFPLEKVERKIKKHSYLDSRVFDRMRERIALFAQGAASGLAPNQLMGLMSNENLEKLKHLNVTLNESARAIVEEYKKQMK